MTELSQEQIDELKLRRKWINAIKIAQKSEKDWLDQSKKIFERYRGKNAKKNSFNILYSNTDTLAPAILNSPPKPDVRRRFPDNNDKLSKAVSEVLGRALTFSIDDPSFMESMELNLYDYLLAGRAVSRIRYVPQIQTIEGLESMEEEQTESEDYDELQWEQVVVEQVQFEDFLRGPGRTWGEVCWIAFKHRLDKEEIAEKFGPDKAEAMAFDEVEDEFDNGVKRKDDDRFKGGTAEVWEIWDKDKKQVMFLSANFSEGFLSILPDPLQLRGFYPIPKPLYAFKDSTSLVPVPLFEPYRQQAEELDRISGRINKIIDGIKVRGIYDAVISELGNLMQGDDNSLIPAQNLSMIIDRGGLDKAIWMMDIKPIAEVLAQLYQQREQCKMVIYEIMGLSDILRGASQASETATAQQIKAQWGGQRVSRMQRDFQYYIRDIVNIMAELMGQRFSIETFKQMTGLQFQDAAQQQQAIAQFQMLAMQAQQAGQQVPPMPEPGITWEQIKQVLADDMQRTFKIDVETDSTLAASQESDMDALQKLIGGLTQMFTGLAPIVQAGAMPVEAVKELSMAIIRRAKLGNAVEDAFDKIQQPPPPPQEQPEQDNSLEVEQVKQQAAMQLEKVKQGSAMQLEELRQQYDATKAQQQQQYEAWKAQLDSNTKLLIAEMSHIANRANQAESLAAQERQAQMQAPEQPDFNALMQSINSQIQEFFKAQEAQNEQRTQSIIEAVTRPKKLIRDPNTNRIMGVE